MLVVVISEVHSIATSIAHDEKLHKAHEGVGVTITSFLFVANNLLNGFEWRNTVAFEFYLNQRQTVDENDDVVALATVGGVDRELVNHLKLILAPVAGIDK